TSEGCNERRRKACVVGVSSYIGQPPEPLCRSRHLRCDRKRPRCSRCLKDDVDCVSRAELPEQPKKKARLANPSKHQPQFPADQPWFRVKKALVFIDENESTIFGTGQVLDFEEETEDPTQLIGETSDHASTSNIETAPTEKQNQTTDYIQASEDPTESAGDPHQPQATIRFEALVEAAAECRAERSRSAPIDLATESIADTAFPTSTSGISPIFEFALDGGTSSSHTSLHQSRLSERNDALSPHNFRSFGSPRDPSTGRISTISPEAAFSLPTTPILSAHEGRLMQHFIEHLAPSIDVCSQEQIFGRLVPRMAFLSPILLTAIFAVASKHISKTIEMTDPTPECYFQETLDHLIPVLNEPDALVEDYVLAAVVILRVMEEMDISLSGYDQQSHLPAIHALISAQERFATRGGLRQAAWWVGFRQEMVVAFINQRPIVPVLEHCNLDRSFSAADDCTWTNRIIVHCADVINHCFQNGSLDQQTYQALRDYGEAWMAHKPRSFNPIFQSQPSGMGSSFTKTWYAGDTIAKGIQHYHLSKILLVAHDPNIPRLGLQRKAFEQTVDDQLRTHARILCGIAQGGCKTAAIWVTTCMGISWCGDRFTSRAEQEELLEILRYTDRVHARHTLSTQKHLIQAWDWPIST
ncbi:hypothetical protein D6D01_03088, partial [Aureobasidium pullulans]